LAASAATGAARTIVIEGSPGIGKSALQLHWAATIADLFPGGCLFADLNGFAPGAPEIPAKCSTRFPRVLGTPPGAAGSGIDSRTALFRTILADKPMLVGSNGRHQRTGAAVAAKRGQRRCDHHPGVPVRVVLRSGATRIALAPLDTEEALDLLGRLAGRARVPRSAFPLWRRLPGSTPPQQVVRWSPW
jgi:hypothetical protein